MMVQAALIGVSGFGRVHYADLMNYHRQGRLELCAATVINQEEETEKCAALRAAGCRLYTDHQEMLRDFSGRLDLCFIPTGIAQHKPMAIEAMKHGANCLIEKPAAPTLQDVHEMREAERLLNKFTAVAFQTVYQPEIQRAKQMLLEGRIGRILSGSCLGCWIRDHNYYSRNRWAGKTGTPDNWILDSPFQNALAHYLNLLLFFTGRRPGESADPVWLEAMLLRGNPEIENTDTAALHLKTSEGTDLKFCCTHAPERNVDPEVRIRGEEGAMTWRFGQITLEDSRGNRIEEIPVDETRQREHLMDAMLERLENPDRFICTLEQAGKHVAVVNAAQESCRVFPVEDSFRRDLPDNNRTWVIPGIEDLFRRMLETEDWSIFPRIGPGFPLVHYSRFSGMPAGDARP